MITFRTFKPGEDAGDVYRFRYRIYEDEMQRNDRYADHEKKTISDPQDSFAYNIAAYNEGSIVGVARVNFCRDGDPGDYLKFYELESVGAEYPDKVSFSTRIMVDSDHRGGVLPLQISVECFKLGQAQAVRWCFCDCNAHLKPFFLKLGYEIQNPQKQHPSFGDVTVLRFDLDDPRHYDRKKSVFARYLDSKR